jgi:hypothetical protein
MSRVTVHFFRLQCIAREDGRMRASPCQGNAGSTSGTRTPARACFNLSSLNDAPAGIAYLIVDSVDVGTVRIRQPFNMNSRNQPIWMLNRTYQHFKGPEVLIPESFSRIASAVHGYTPRRYGPRSHLHHNSEV